MTAQTPPDFVRPFAGWLPRMAPTGPGDHALFESSNRLSIKHMPGRRRSAGTPTCPGGFSSNRTEVLFTREGGSGPEADLAEILAAPLVFHAVGLDSDRIHAPNEKVEMDLLLKGTESAAYLWEELVAGRGGAVAQG